MDLSGRKNFSEFENFFKAPDGGNQSNQYPTSFPVPHWILVLVKPCLYMILAVGIGGNSYSILYFLRTGQLKRIASLKFMTALAVADLIYLITLGCQIIFEQLLQIAVNDVSCKLNTYLIYLSCFLASWFIVVLTYERFVMVLPSKRHTLRNPCWANKIIFSISIIGPAFCIPVAVTTGLVENSVENSSSSANDSTATEVYCVVVAGFEMENRFFSAANMVLCFTLPLVAIFVLNTSIMWMIFNKRFQRKRKGYPRAIKFIKSVDFSIPIANSETPRKNSEILGKNFETNENFLSKFSFEFENGGNDSFRARANSHRFRREQRLTSQLLTVSFAYLILNLPQYVARLKFEFLGFDGTNGEFWQVWMLFSSLAFQTQFAINCLLYLMFRTNFYYFTNFRYM